MERFVPADEILFNKFLAGNQVFRVWNLICSKKDLVDKKKKVHLHSQPREHLAINGWCDSSVGRAKD
jgi:hypothetical protein